MRATRSVLGAAAAAAAVLLTTTPAGAGTTVDTGADVSTDPTGAHVEFRRRTRTWAETRRSASSPASGCLRRWRLAGGAFYLRRQGAGEDPRRVAMPPPPGPEYRPYHVFCDGDYVTSVWAAPRQFGVDPREIAERVVRDLPYPAATIGVVPSGRGLTGLASWFWIEGYGTEPLAASRTELGVTVAVEATPTTVSWDFGDGTTTRGADLGVAPPGRPTVVHTFERRAPHGTRVRAVLRLDVRWRADGGPWQALDPIGRTATLDYPVVESRAALVPDR